MAITVSPISRSSEVPSGRYGSDFASDFQDREVRIRIGTDEAGIELPFVGQLDLHFARLEHNVFVGQNIPVRANDDPRTETALGLAFGHGLEKIAEEILEKWVAAERVRRSLDFL